MSGDHNMFQKDKRVEAEFVVSHDVKAGKTIYCDYRVRISIELIEPPADHTHWKETRLAYGKTLREVARAVGTSMGNLCRIENGKQIPSEGLSARLTAKFDEWKQHAGDRA